MKGKLNEWYFTGQNMYRSQLTHGVKSIKMKWGGIQNFGVEF